MHHLGHRYEHYQYNDSDQQAGVSPAVRRNQNRCNQREKNLADAGTGLDDA